MGQGALAAAPATKRMSVAVRAAWHHNGKA
jgi:hypothetical protein